MKISKLYSNFPKIFVPIEFNRGLNVVVAEIRLPENKERDTHNLGKSTLGALIDFCLLEGKDGTFFLFDQSDLFKEFVFFAEIELLNGHYLTIRRSVSEGSKASFKLHVERHQDFSSADSSNWDQWMLPFEKSRDLLDGILDLTALRPWSFRKVLGYLLRGQADYIDVFHLNKFKGKHVDWKPVLSHILGFDAAAVEEHYTVTSELGRKVDQEKLLSDELSGSLSDLSEIQGLLQLKSSEATEREEMLNAFDFSKEDRKTIDDLVEDANAQLAEINSKKYYVRQETAQIEASLKTATPLFDPNQAAKLFEEAGVLFPNQVKTSFERLIRFNKEITEERRAYLREELKELKRVQTELDEIAKEFERKRAKSLTFLQHDNLLDKYKSISQELVDIRADIQFLRGQSERLERLRELRKEISRIEAYKNELMARIEENVAGVNTDETGTFSKVRRYFTEIIKSVVDSSAILTVSTNSNGNVDFGAKFTGPSGRLTKADDGHTYKKLLCIAFDLALLRSHLDRRFPRFVYHDGVYESLDNRKKEKLTDVMRSYADSGVQQIITLIDSEIPFDKGAEEFFLEGEVVLVLHDEGQDGRLFKMPPW